MHISFFLGKVSSDVQEIKLHILTSLRWKLYYFIILEKFDIILSLRQGYFDVKKYLGTFYPTDANTYPLLPVTLFACCSDYLDNWRVFQYGPESAVLYLHVKGKERKIWVNGQLVRQWSNLLKHKGAFTFPTNISMKALIKNLPWENHLEFDCMLLSFLFLKNISHLDPSTKNV